MKSKYKMLIFSVLILTLFFILLCGNKEITYSIEDLEKKIDLSKLKRLSQGEGGENSKADFDFILNLYKKKYQIEPDKAEIYSNEMEKLGIIVFVYDSIEEARKIKEKIQKNAMPGNDLVLLRNNIIVISDMKTKDKFLEVFGAFFK